jgi:hypothetical protein
MVIGSVRLIIGRGAINLWGLSKGFITTMYDPIG